MSLRSAAIGFGRKVIPGFPAYDFAVSNVKPRRLCRFWRLFLMYCLSLVLQVLTIVPTDHHVAITPNRRTEAIRTIAECEMQNAECRVQTAESETRIANDWMTRLRAVEKVDRFGILAWTPSRKMGAS